MKTRALSLFGIIGVAALLGTGCYTHTRRVVVREPVVAPTGPVVVSSEPPPPRHEVVGVAPSAENVWIPGYWAYENNRWVWMPGHWETRPRPSALWVQGHWTRRVNGWVWTPGHWE